MNHKLATLITLAILWGCHATTVEEQTTVYHTLERPQALLFVDDHLLVSETAYGSEGWGPGHISVINPASGAVTNRWTTTQKNPQRIRRHDDLIFVVNSGAFDFSDFSDPKSLTNGGIDVLSPASINSVMPIVDNWEIPLSSEAGTPTAPVDLAIGGEHILITSALRPSVWFSANRERPSELNTVDLNSDSDLGLGSVLFWNEHFVVVDFNSDRVFLIEGEGDKLACSAPLRGDEIALEGSQSPVIFEDELFVLMSLSGRVIALELEPFLAECEIQTRVVVPSTGQVPNDMHIRNNGLYLVNSGDNNIIRYNLSSGIEDQRWVLPVGSNPWHIAFDENERYMAVSEWGANAVSIIDLQSNEIRRVTGSDGR